MGKIFDSEPGCGNCAQSKYNGRICLEYRWHVVHRVINGLKLEVNAYWTHLENAMVRRDFELEWQTIHTLPRYYLPKYKRYRMRLMLKFMVCSLEFVDAQLNNRWLLTTRMNLQKGEEELDDGSISPSRHVAPYFGE